MKIRTKKGAIELSIGTVVIIVLAMSMLILGIVLIRNIFSSAGGAITSIDQGVKNEINRLFSENSERTLALYPDTGTLEIKQGERDSGFAISLRNLDEDAVNTFNYAVSVVDFTQCDQGNPVTTGKVSIIGQSENGISLGPGEKLQNERLVKIAISDTAELCTFRLKVETTGCTHCPQSSTMDIVVVAD